MMVKIHLSNRLGLVKPANTFANYDFVMNFIPLFCLRLQIKKINVVFVWRRRQKGLNQDKSLDRKCIKEKK